MTESLAGIEARIVRIRTLVRATLDPKVPTGVVYEYSYGTGAVIGSDGLIATVHHLLRNRQRPIAGGEDVAILTSTSSNYLPVDVLLEDPASDTALLRANPRALRSGKHFDLPPEAAPLPLPGERSYVVGLRAEAPAESFEMGIIRGTFIEARERLAEIAAGRPMGQGPWVTISQMILQGYSGGAILDGSGNLIGLVVGAPEWKGRWVEFSYGVGIEAILNLVAKTKQP